MGRDTGLVVRLVGLFLLSAPRLETLENKLLFIFFSHTLAASRILNLTTIIHLGLTDLPRPCTIQVKLAAIRIWAERVRTVCSPFLKTCLLLSLLPTLGDVPPSPSTGECEHLPLDTCPRVSLGWPSHLGGPQTAVLFSLSLLTAGG